MNIKKISMLLTGSACALCLISQDGMGSSKFFGPPLSKNIPEHANIIKQMNEEINKQEQNKSQPTPNTNNDKTEFVLPTNASEVEALFKEKKAIPEDQKGNVQKALDRFYENNPKKISLGESLINDEDAFKRYIPYIGDNLAAEIRDNVKDLEMKDGPLAIKIKDLEMKDGSLAIKIKSLEIVTASLNKW